MLFGVDEVGGWAVAGCWHNIERMFCCAAAFAPPVAIKFAANEKESKSAAAGYIKPSLLTAASTDF